MQSIRLLPFASADGAVNMAADETLVRSAADGVASLRFYGWTTATLSLGYFQPAAVRSCDSRLTPLPFVRRPSGGATLVHHHELTYCLAVPPGAPWQTGEWWMPRMHRIIIAALSDLDVPMIEPVTGAPIKHGEVLCFQQLTPGDLLSGGRKIVGSAQRKYHQALMQHGSILLVQSEHTPELPGLRELCGVTVATDRLAAAIVRRYEVATGWRVYDEAWTEPEKMLAAQLAEEKYATAAWNERR